MPESVGIGGTPASVRDQAILEPDEIRLILNGTSDRLADFAASSRLHASDPKGDTPLHLAARTGNLVLCDLFIRAGADPNAPNHARQTPADVATSGGHMLAGRLLNSLLASARGASAVAGDDGSPAAGRASDLSAGVPESRPAPVQQSAADAAAGDLDEFLNFEPEEFSAEEFLQCKSKPPAGMFVAAATMTGQGGSVEEEGNWEPDLSPARVAGEGISSGPSVSVVHGADQDFLKVRNRGRKSSRRSVIQTGTRLSIGLDACIAVAEVILRRRCFSSDDLETLVAHCRGNAEAEDLEANLRRVLEAAGFEQQGQSSEQDISLWEARTDISSNELSEAIEATLTRATRLPGTQRFLMDKSDERHLLEPMVRVKQELHLGILSCEAAVERILEVIRKIEAGSRDPNSVSLRSLMPSRAAHAETVEFLAAADTLRAWNESGRVMEGKRRREVLVALEALDLSLAFHKELAGAVEEDRAAGTVAAGLGLLVEAFERATEHLILTHIPYVRRFAARNVQAGEDPEDVFQVAFMGLHRSTRRFDPERGVRFFVYCTLWMTQTLSRWRADEGGLIRVPAHRHEDLSRFDRAERELETWPASVVPDDDLAAELGWSADKVAKFRSIPRLPEYLDGAEAWEELLGEQEQVLASDEAQIGKIVADALSELSERQAQVIRLRFGLGGEDEMTLEELGQMYGVTRERIRQIEAKALALLRHPTRLGRYSYLLES